MNIPRSFSLASMNVALVLLLTAALVGGSGTSSSLPGTYAFHGGWPATGNHDYFVTGAGTFTDSGSATGHLTWVITTGGYLDGIATCTVSSVTPLIGAVNGLALHGIVQVVERGLGYYLEPGSPCGVEIAEGPTAASGTIRFDQLQAATPGGQELYNQLSFLSFDGTSFVRIS